VNFHNPFLAYENGEDFIEFFYRAAEGKIETLINTKRRQEGRRLLASFGPNRETGQPITTCEWIDRLGSQAWAVVAAGTCAPMAEFTLATTTN